MHTVTTALAGYRGVRGELLVALKRAQPLAVHELAERFAVTPNALRRHLKALEDDGVVRWQREVRGVGGPVFAYSLSAAGEALFPQDYSEPLLAALESARERDGGRGVARIFERRWSALAEGARSRLEALPLPERAALLAELLSAHGYMAEAESDGGGVTIRERHCALREVASRFPEVCDAEAHFIERVLGAPVERTAHMVKGCKTCEYRVKG
jgi:DeoR family transcriptional regulator, suf operon transcriptional repressor